MSSSGKQQDEWIDQSDPRLAQEEPRAWLNVVCFFGALLSLATPVTALWAFGHAILAYFSKRNPQRKQAGLSALCGFFFAWVLFLLWAVIGAYYVPTHQAP